MDLFLVFLIGLCFGSFLNVCIYRIPLKKSIVFPPSTCPKCGRRLGFFELIPVVSFLIQKGRCRGCAESISIRYPVVELLTGIILFLIYWKFGFSMITFKYMVLALIIIAVSFIDLDHQIIPNTIVLPGIIAGLIFGYSNIMDALLGMLCGFGIIAIIILISRGGMGWGDAKLLAMFGAFLGWQSTVYSLFVGSLIGAVIGVTLIVLKKIERKTPIPFGPYLSLGALLWIFLPWWFY